MLGRTHALSGAAAFAGLSAGLLHWAEAETDPTRIDWAARQAGAAIPFEVICDRPVNPCEKTAIWHGRNEMGRWGETRMADALVTLTMPPFAARYLLMVERADGCGWAVPGGCVEPGETGLQAAVRELAEETGLEMFGGETFRALAPCYVPDPRASGEAWAVTIPVHIDLGTPDMFPAVTGGDDARRAEWIPADSYGQLTEALADRYMGKVFTAHVGMLREFLTCAPWHTSRIPPISKSKGRTPPVSSPDTGTAASQQAGNISPALESCSCGATPGQNHDPLCDHARCPECGDQRIACGDHQDCDRPARWHGIDQRAEVARALDWWVTPPPGIDRLVEDYTRVLIAEVLGQITWDRHAQRYVIGQIDNGVLDRHGR